MVTDLPAFRRYNVASVSVSVSFHVTPDSEPSYVAQSGLEPETLQPATPWPLPPKCWYYSDTRSPPPPKDTF